MAEPNWTPAQAAAIADRGGTLLVSAAAGSGKTAVLAERAVGLITDPAHPVEADRLLIVTFTNAAAAELRARIAERLAARARQEPDSGRLRRQRMLLQRAPICTIDAFCLDLLRRHFSALDLPPDFSPIGDGDRRALRDAALAEAMEQAVQSPDFCAFAGLYGRSRSDAAAAAAVEQLYDFLQVLPRPEAALQHFLAPWRTPDGFAASPWYAVLAGTTCREARQLQPTLAAAQRLCALDCEAAVREASGSRKTAAAQEAAMAKARDKFAEPLDRLAQTAAFLAQVQALTAPGMDPAQAAACWDELAALLAPCRAGAQPIPGFRGMRRRLAGEHRETVRAAAAQAERLYGDLLARVSGDTAAMEADRRTALPMLEALAAAEQDFAARYAEKKQERKLLEFGDMEQLALRLLQGPDGARTPLCEAVCAGFDAVMVDEYQDTNALQDALYTCLAHPSGDNLFLVGDIKQSIYRFRQADPAVFAARQAQYPPLAALRPRPRPEAPGADAARPAPAQIALDANFRSAPAVVDFINAVFGRLMSPELGGVRYGEGQRLVCGAPGAFAGRAEVCALEGAEPADEARWTARRIRALAAAGTPVRAAGGTRPLQYEDCCILLATRGRFSLYAQALAAEGIPVCADSADDLLDAPEMRPLLALLRVLDNPACNIELAAAMRSALFGFTDDDLLALRAAAGRRSLYGALVAAVQSAAQDPFFARCRAFYARLTVLRQLARSLPVDELLEEIFASTGYLAAVGAGPNGPRRRDEVRRFAAWAANAGTGGLAALLRVIDATEAAGGLVDPAPVRGRPGCVSIMTIHRSKGLQFPAVFLADTGRRFNLDDARRQVLLHRELGLGLALRGAGGWYSTAARTAIQGAVRRESLSEEMRLLYVALTRAQDLLFVTLPLAKPADAVDAAAAALRAGIAPALYARAACFADWLLPALLCHPDGGALRAAASAPCLLAELTGETVPAAAGAAAIALEAPPAAPEEPDDAARREAAAPDAALTARILGSFAWEYPYAAQTRIPAKVSVTGVIRRAEATALERPGFLSAGGMTGAERGTALHAFLQHADFGALAAALAAAPGEGALDAAVEAETQRQLAARLADPEILAQLDRAGIAAFVRSDAFRRIAAAKRVLREYDFITGLPASALPPAPDLPQEGAGGATVLVQGIADLVLEFDDHLELLDYKTDRGKTAAELAEAYRPQLALYARAIETRFAPRRVTFRGLYSFALGRLIEV